MTPTADGLTGEAATEELRRTEPISAPLVGGRYELGTVLGRGGMSTVYEALDRGTNTRVAVKVFRPGVELADSPARRLREVQLASVVRHPGLVAVLDAQLDDSDRIDGCAFLVTELVEGQTLSERIRAKPLSEREMVGLAAALSSALAAIHEAGIIHRDIKPANVLIPKGEDGLLHPKVADFGIALMVDSTRMTATGYLAGTANYLSPEQVQGQNLTPASDIYALGLVLIEAVCGTPIFGGNGVEAAVARLHADPAPPGHLDPRLTRLLTRMTDRSPTNRPTARSAAEEFRQLLGSGLTSDIFAIDGASLKTRPARALPRRVGKRRVIVLLSGGAAAAAIGLSLAVSLAGHSHAPTRAPAPNVAAASSSAAQSSDSLAAPSTAGAGVIAASNPPPSFPAAAQPGMEPATVEVRATPNIPAPDAAKTKGNGHGKGKGNGNGNDD